MDPSEKSPISDNETFIILMQVASENEEIRTSLLRLLRQDPFHRKSLFQTFVREMQMKGAPGDFVAAIAVLRDDAVAEEALRWLERA
ncbi:MAG: hypothetical protein ACYTHM_21360 [Planctomycetota bacterium]